jgi:hypothetical protein
MEESKMRRDIFAYVHLACYVGAMAMIVYMFYKMKPVLEKITLTLGG